MEALLNAKNIDSSCNCPINAMTARAETEFLIRQAQGKIAIDLTYGTGNSYGVNEAAMAVLTSIRRYFDTKATGVEVPGRNTAYLFMQAVVDETDPINPVYALAHEVEGEQQ